MCFMIKLHLLILEMNAILLNAENTRISLSNYKLSKNAVGLK